MTKRTRTILFLICLFLFLIVAPSAIFYSQGYRFSLEAKKMVQTGGLFLKVLPSSAEVYINGKLTKKTSFLFNSVFIENLLPKTYVVKIEKEGYHSWEKNLEIKEKQVTEVKNIVLISKTPEFIFLDYNLPTTQNIESLWFSTSGKKVVFKKNSEADIWSLELFDIQKKTHHFLVSEKNLTETNLDFQQNIELLDLKWSPDGEKILLEIGLGAKTEYFIAELDKEPLALTSLDFLGKNIKKFSFNPADSSKIFFIKEVETNNLYQADFFKKTVGLQPILKNLTAYAPTGSNIIWLNSQGFLYKTDFSGKIIEILTREPFKIKPDLRYRIIGFDNKIFLQASDRLFFLDPDSKSFKKISEFSTNLKFSPDLKKVVYTDNSEIWIFYLEHLEEQPQKEAQEKVFLGRWADKIDNVFWLTSHYLIFNTGNKIKIAEIDDRDQINIIDLAEFSNSEIFWSNVDKKLYILSEGNLFVAEGLLP